MRPAGERSTARLNSGRSAATRGTRASQTLLHGALGWQLQAPLQVALEATTALVLISSRPLLLRVCLPEADAGEVVLTRARTLLLSCGCHC